MPPTCEPSAADTTTPRQQILAGRTYELDPSRFDAEKVSPITKAVKAAAIIVVSPALLLVGSAATAFMYFGPMSWRRTFLAWFLPLGCGKLNEKFKPEREHLLADCTGDSRALDVGSGGGAYMQYLQKASHIVALEPVEQMHATIRKTAESYGIRSDRLEVFAMDVETYLRERFKNPEKDAFDWVILGNVLCEVEDQASTLDAVNLLLRPGTGRVYFSEHVACCAGSWKRRFQEIINPLWRVVSGSCNMQRATR